MRTHLSIPAQSLRNPVLEEGLETLPASASPSLHSLLQFWFRAADSDGVPSREQFDAFTLRRWLGHISIYEAVDSGRDFRIRLEGTAIVAITGEDWTGKRASQVDIRYGCRLAEFMGEIMATRRPMVHTMRVFQNQVERITRLLLPVRSQREGLVDQVFLAIYVDPQRTAA